MDKAEGTTYRDELLSKIVDICSQNNYQYITNFEWSVLFKCEEMIFVLNLYVTFLENFEPSSESL